MAFEHLAAQQGNWFEQADDKRLASSSEESVKALIRSEEMNEAPPTGHRTEVASQKPTIVVLNNKITFDDCICQCMAVIYCLGYGDYRT